MANTINNVKEDLRKLGNKAKAVFLSGFFKTGKGQYGEGDVFLGVTVPETRKVAKKYCGLPLKEIKKLLKSSIHEHRLAALLILTDKYKKADDDEKERLVEFYLDNIRRINNWDLVDMSAPNILGDYLQEKDKSILYKLAESDNLWERRISIISTLAFIKKGLFEDALRISKILLNDRQDLIHKAVGWMLREIGKRDQQALEQFLERHYKKMPRTMLRYTIEKFEEGKRAYYLKPIKSN